MTNLQLFIAVFVPALIVLVNFAATLNSNHRLQNRLDKLEDRIEARFERSEEQSETQSHELAALRDQVRSVEVGLANLRAEMFEQFQPRTS